MSLSVRRATAPDILLLIGLMEEFYAEANYPLDTHWAANSFAALLANENYGALWIAEYEQEPAGYIALTVHFSMEYGGLCGSIDDLFVRPRFRRQKIASAAMEALLSECHQRGLLAVQVETGPDNTAAQTLYRSYELQPRDERLTFILHLI